MWLQNVQVLQSVDLSIVVLLQEVSLLHVHSLQVAAPQQVLQLVHTVVAVAVAIAAVDLTMVVVLTEVVHMAVDMEVMVDADKKGIR